MRKSSFQNESIKGKNFIMFTYILLFCPFLDFEADYVNKNYDWNAAVKRATQENEGSFIRVSTTLYKSQQNKTLLCK